MSSKAFSILHLDKSASQDEIEKAYRQRTACFKALTARGPLRYYRQALLDAAEKAYNELQHEGEWIRERPKSLLARKVSAIRQHSKRPLKKSPWKSERIVPESLPAKVARARRGIEKDLMDGTPERAEVEDRFCLSVIYRLEGDFIRYSARQELLGLARQMQIHPFRANLLMAQIVEAVRRHRLYESIGNESIQIEPQSRQSGGIWLVLGAAIFLAVLIDALLIRLME